MTADNSSEEAIIQKILEDAEAQARRILDGARRTGDSHRKKAETEAARVRQEIMDQAQAKADTLRAKEIATARMEAKRILLAAREEVVNAALHRIEEELAGLRKSEGYREILLRLAREAIQAIGGSKVVLKLSKADEGLVDQDFLAELERTLVADEAKARVEIDVRFEADLDDGGCIATSGDGRIIFDNTFTGRFERMKPELRSMLIREIAAKDE